MRDAADAYNRISAYLQRRETGTGIDRELIHSFDASPDGGFYLYASDLQALLDTAPAATVNEARRRMRDQTK